jgi:mannose-6-phosphate isomerase-like protein (cupin superfamily)
MSEMKPPPNMGFVLRPGEGRQIDLGNFSMVVKASATQAQRAFTLLESDEPSNFGPPLHVHRDAAEAFYVLSGDYTMFVGDEQFSCPVGSFIYIPSGLPHSFRTGSGPGRKLNLYAPAAMVGYFDELSQAISRGAATTELDGIAERYGMDIIGPVPEGYV